MKSEYRDCGDCVLCCSIMRVIELDKPEAIKCKYCTKYGCSIYEERPASCRGFHCLWQFRKLFKDNPFERRPDRLGALIIPKKEIKGYSPALQFNALDRKVFEKEKIRSLIDNFRIEGFNIALVVAGKKQEGKLLLSRSKKL